MAEPLFGTHAARPRVGLDTSGMQALGQDRTTLANVTADLNSVPGLIQSGVQTGADLATTRARNQQMAAVTKGQQIANTTKQAVQASDIASQRSKNYEESWKADTAIELEKRLREQKISLAEYQLGLSLLETGAQRDALAFLTGKPVPTSGSIAPAPSGGPTPGEIVPAAKGGAPVASPDAIEAKTPGIERSPGLKSIDLGKPVGESRGVPPGSIEPAKYADNYTVGVDGDKVTGFSKSPESVTPAPGAIVGLAEAKPAAAAAPAAAAPAAPNAYVLGLAKNRMAELEKTPVELDAKRALTRAAELANTAKTLDQKAFERLGLNPSYVESLQQSEAGRYALGSLAARGTKVGPDEVQNLIREYTTMHYGATQAPALATQAASNSEEAYKADAAVGHHLGTVKNINDALKNLAVLEKDGSTLVNMAELRGIAAVNPKVDARLQAALGNNPRLWFSDGKVALDVGQAKIVRETLDSFRMEAELTAQQQRTIADANHLRAGSNYASATPLEAKDKMEKLGGFYGEYSRLNPSFASEYAHNLSKFISPKVDPIERHRAALALASKHGIVDRAKLASTDENVRNAEIARVKPIVDRMTLLGR